MSTWWDDDDVLYEQANREEAAAQFRATAPDPGDHDYEGWEG